MANSKENHLSVFVVVFLHVKGWKPVIIGVGPGEDPRFLCFFGISINFHINVFETHENSQTELSWLFHLYHTTNRKKYHLSILGSASPPAGDHASHLPRLNRPRVSLRSRSTRSNPSGRLIAGIPCIRGGPGRRFRHVANQIAPLTKSQSIGSEAPLSLRGADLPAAGAGPAEG